ncbi:hypothetical protein [Rhabdothermincola sediminis]|uniref:hypothetical protein n=1 Tax=Rhabdothermincola sediminis TaxID=2751370 RepID=UPI001AA08468|nr:hypothetical protein [Rhabdothermincola sediminis]
MAISPAAAAAPFRFDRTWTFPVTAGAFWAMIERTEDFPEWWRWLRAFDADGLYRGARARFEIRAPLPYTLRFEVQVVEVMERAVVGTTVAGDLTGPARLELLEVPGGCRARLCWALTPTNPAIGRLARVARPLLAWSHDQIVRAGVRQFEQVVTAHAR